MYILCKLEKRAETTDTILILGSPHINTLEEILLSIFDEIYEREINIASKEDDYNEDKIRTWCIDIMKCYQIINIPILC